MIFPKDEGTRLDLEYYQHCQYVINFIKSHIKNETLNDKTLHKIVLRFIQITRLYIKKKNTDYNKVFFERVTKKLESII